MKNLVGIWVNLSRAYEIALLGNFKIQIVFNKEYKQGLKIMIIVNILNHDIYYY
jgi:hypothetical protein